MVVPVQLFRKNLRFQTLFSCLCLCVMAITVTSTDPMIPSGPTVPVRRIRITAESATKNLTTYPLTWWGLETFNKVPLNTKTFTSHFGTGGEIAGTFSDLTLKPNDQYGGGEPDGTPGHYLFHTDGNARLKFSKTGLYGLNWCSFMWSSMGQNDRVTIKRDGQIVRVVTGYEVYRELKHDPSYVGNKRFIPPRGTELSAVINIQLYHDLFDELLFGGGIELDNIVVGNWKPGFHY